MQLEEAAGLGKEEEAVEVFSDFIFGGQVADRYKQSSCNNRKTIKMIYKTGSLHGRVGCHRTLSNRGPADRAQEEFLSAASIKWAFSLLIPYLKTAKGASETSSL